RGGAGTAALALVRRPSVQHTEPRYVSRTFRSSPGGGGGGTGVARPDRMAKPTLRISQPAITATATASGEAPVNSQATTPAATRVTRVGHEILGLRTASA